MPVVVIVDDQPVNQQIFSRIAASIDDGIQVHTFGDPAQALEWLAANTPDLIVTDYKMPGMDGAEFTRRLRANPDLAEVPVVVITVFEERSLRLRALNAGATDFLQSPIDHREFVTRARNLLKLRKQQLLLASRADNLERKLERSERSLEQAIRDSSERLAQVIDVVPAMISATDRDGRILFMNAYQTELIGADSASVIGRDAAEVLGQAGAARSKDLDRLVIENGQPLPSFEEEITDRAGARRVFLTTKSPLRDTANEIIGVVTSSLDITERKLAERNLFRIAHHDGLTGLPNRILLRDRLRREIARSRQSNGRFAVHLLDLDGFKSVNDAFGHRLGDKLLKQVAQRLGSLAREGDFVARLDGDEFALLQTGISFDEAATEFASRVAHAVSEPYVIGPESIAVTASIGVSVYPTDGDDIDELLRKADLAMYRAKDGGGHRHRFYTSDMRPRAPRAAALEAELRAAIDQKAFVLHYQPQVSLATGRVVGMEALIRLRQSDGEIVSPAAFLPQAEENGLIVPINEWVLREACSQAVAWQRAGLPNFRVGVNLSPIQIRNQSVPLLVARILAETSLDPKFLDLELTESAVMQDTEAAAIQLRQLRQLGVQISIDDFGTGYSSLSYIKHFPIDRLKIDQSFVRGLMTDRSDGVIVRTIVNLGHSLGVHVLAEGVETADQVAFLRSENCDEVQGNYFGAPLPADEIATFLRNDPRIVRTA